MCQCWIVFFFSCTIDAGYWWCSWGCHYFYFSSFFFNSIMWSFQKPFYHTAGRMMCSSVASSCDQWCIIVPWGLWSSPIAQAQLCQFIANLAICSILEHKCVFICKTVCKCLNDWFKCVKIILMLQEVCEGRKFFNAQKKWEEVSYNWILILPVVMAPRFCRFM